jgi:hypothetical protein
VSRFIPSRASRLSHRTSLTVAHPPANPQESEAELENAQAQFNGGKEAFERQSVNNEEIVTEKRDIEAKIKKAEKLDQQIAVRFLPPLAFSSVKMTQFPLARPVSPREGVSQDLGGSRRSQ